jgi:hypothetical protein
MRFITSSLSHRESTVSVILESKAEYLLVSQVQTFEVREENE